MTCGESSELKCGGKVDGLIEQVGYARNTGITQRPAQARYEVACNLLTATSDRNSLASDP
jgi:hypothetical protein